MEPASTVTALLGLALQYASSKSQDEILDETEFLTWLNRHQHKQVRKLLEENDQALFGLRSLLNRRADEVTAKLDALAELLTALASRVPELAEIVNSFAPALSIPEPAYQLLRQMDEQGTEYFLISQVLGSDEPRLISSSGSLSYLGETRFWRDDLETLVSYGLLHIDYNRSGDPMYCFTRQAAQFVAQVESQTRTEEDIS